MSTTARKSLVLRRPVVVDVGCSCRRPKLLISSLFSSSSSCSRGGRRKSSTSTTNSTSPSTTTTTAAATTTTTTNSSSWDPPSFTTNSLYEEEYYNPLVMTGYSSPAPPQEVNEEDETTRRRRGRRGRKRRGTGSRVERESVAVAVETEKPYEDFRESMVEMVVEKEMYAWEDLNAMLHRFLSLNSPRHHPLILRAFADLWSGLFSPPSPLRPPPSPPPYY